MSNKIVCSLQAIKSEQAALAKLTPEQKELRKSCCDADSSKFFLKGDEPMPLLYRKAGFSQYQTPSGYVMYRTPCGTKVNPGGSKCRGFLSAILESRPDLKPLSDSVKTASPPRKKPDVLAHKLRSSKGVNQPATPSTPSPCIAKSAVKSSPLQVKSPNAYGYFRQLSPHDQFLAVCDSSKMAQFFKHFSEVARCVRDVDGQSCGGRYTVSGFVDTGTGNEMTSTISCDRCKHERYFGDRCTNKHQTQTAQCGHLPGSSVDEATIDKTVLYNFLLAGRGKYEQYKTIFGKTGDAYSKDTFDKAACVWLWLCWMKRWRHAETICERMNNGRRDTLVLMGLGVLPALLHHMECFAHERCRPGADF